MTKRRIIAILGLCSLFASVPAAQEADAKPGRKLSPSAVRRVQPSAFEDLINGKVQVSAVCSPEFVNWIKKYEFYDRPDVICVKWYDKKPVVWARWELYKKVGTEETKVASGNVGPNGLDKPTNQFTLDLRNVLPYHNAGSTKTEYKVKVISKRTADAVKLSTSTMATLVHLPKNSEVVPPPANPYACSGGGDHERHVVLELPKMTVNHTTNTSGDGDRDELYFVVAQRGPGETTFQKRLPSADDYYEAKSGKTVASGKWTNKNEQRVSHPKFFNGKLKHDQRVTLAITAMEQDNSDLADIKQGLTNAMHAVAAIATAVGGGYGLIVAAVAESVAAGAQMIPSTKNHDFVGLVGVRLHNECGYIKTTWTTFEEHEVPGIGKLTNQFLDIDTQDAIEARLAVLSDVNQFWPNGVDYGPFELTGTSDQFWWVANGTNGSQYTFLLKERLVQ